MNLSFRRWLGAFLCCASLLSANAQQDRVSLTLTNGQKRLNLPLFPGIDRYRVLGGTDLGVGLAPLSGTLSGFTWTAPVSSPQEFYSVEATPMSQNATLSALVLNRLAYGPTPDDLERLRTNGAAAYITEQLAPENIVESLDIDGVVTNRDWQRIVVTGIAGNRNFYIYQTQPGDVYVDDVMVVPGPSADGAGNVVLNGDFEITLTNNWVVSPNLTNSYIDTSEKHSGNSSLHVISTAGGSTSSSAITQNFPTLNTSGIYTLSFWWKPGTNLNANLTIRFSNSGITSSTVPPPLNTLLALNMATTDDLRAWHVLHAVRSKKQLQEVLLQFLENHFVTQVTKTRDYFDQFYDGGENDRWASHFEYLENKKWRAALNRPDCTFSNLLTISAESPAMIIYLDTVNSTGSGSNIPNENYAREILELFTMGVDNGYDQNDITLLSRAWTGWSVQIVNATNEANPFAAKSTTRRPGSTNTTVPIPTGDLDGVWTFNFKSGNHWTRSSTTVFPNKTVTNRFGAPWAGRSYQLALPIVTGTNAIQDGYKVIAHLSNLPYTEEFISVKLCRLFVHENFATGYDFTDAETTPEEELVKACMLAWENNLPKGQIRKVLEVIFNSDLFRSQGAALHKVKTPLEYTVSVVRALRSENSDGTATATTDGYNLKTPMDRMGAMKLFDRAEPDGYPEGGAPWISAGTLAERLRFVQSYLLPTSANNRDVGGNTFADPVALLKKYVPSASWNDAGAVADYFLSILLPGEGKANLDLYRTAAINFLNTADDGAGSPFSGVFAAATYDTRVRGMISAIMTSQRFHEQ
jgi:uncharacterized protein (DUF1800 family)